MSMIQNQYSHLNITVLMLGVLLLTVGTTAEA